MKVKFFDLIFPAMAILAIVSFIASPVVLVNFSVVGGGLCFLVFLISLTIARKGYFEIVERDRLYSPEKEEEEGDSR